VKKRGEPEKKGKATTTPIAKKNAQKSKKIAVEIPPELSNEALLENPKHDTIELVEEKYEHKSEPASDEELGEKSDEIIVREEEEKHEEEPPKEKPATNDAPNQISEERFYQECDELVEAKQALDRERKETIKKQHEDIKAGLVKGPDEFFAKLSKLDNDASTLQSRAEALCRIKKGLQLQPRLKFEDVFGFKDDEPAPIRTFSSYARPAQRILLGKDPEDLPDLTTKSSPISSKPSQFLQSPKKPEEEPIPTCELGKDFWDKINKEREALPKDEMPKQTEEIAPAETPTKKKKKTAETKAKENLYINSAKTNAKQSSSEDVEEFPKDTPAKESGKKKSADPRQHKKTPKPAPKKKSSSSSSSPIYIGDTDDDEVKDPQFYEGKGNEWTVKAVSNPHYVDAGAFQIPCDPEDAPEPRPPRHFKGWHFDVKWKGGEVSEEPLCYLERSNILIGKYFDGLLKEQIQRLRPPPPALIDKVLDHTTIHGRIVFKCKWLDGHQSDEHFEDLFPDHLHPLHLYLRRIHDNLQKTEPYGNQFVQAPVELPPLPTNVFGARPLQVAHMKYVGHTNQMESNDVRFLVNYSDKTSQWETFDEARRYVPLMKNFFMTKPIPCKDGQNPNATPSHQSSQKPSSQPTKKSQKKKQSSQSSSDFQPPKKKNTKGNQPRSSSSASSSQEEDED
jgi:hypothetical protein